MNIPTKIALLVAAILLAWNAAGFSASASEHRALFSETTDQIILSSAHSKGEPLAYPDNRQTKPGILQIDSLSDVEVDDLHIDISGIPSIAIPLYGSKAGIGADSGNITLLLQRKKIIYPFHSFL